MANNRTSNHYTSSCPEWNRGRFRKVDDPMMRTVRPGSKYRGRFLSLLFFLGGVSPRRGPVKLLILQDEDSPAWELLLWRVLTDGGATGVSQL